MRVAARRNRNRPSSIGCCGERAAAETHRHSVSCVRTRKGHTSAVANRLTKHGDRVESTASPMELVFRDCARSRNLRASEADPESRPCGRCHHRRRRRHAPDTRQTERCRRQPADIGTRSSRHRLRWRDKVGIAVMDFPVSKGAANLDGGRAEAIVSLTSPLTDEPRGPLQRLRAWHSRRHADWRRGRGVPSVTSNCSRNGRSHNCRITPYRGVVPNTRIISLKVLDANGGGYTSFRTCEPSSSPSTIATS